MRRVWTFGFVLLAAALPRLMLAAQSDSGRATSTTRQRPFIGRILGAFDAGTGEPVEGVEVMDLMSKTSALTTGTGTVALSFVDSGGSIIRLRKPGYAPQLLTVENHEDQPPITVILQRNTPTLGPVVTTSKRVRGPADTLRKLDVNGFYDRRDHSGAAPMAFVLGEKIQNMATFDDFTSVTGRPICTSNMYVDGVRVIDAGESVSIGGRTLRKRNLKKNSLDQIVSPTDVAAIENYRVAEVPIEYATTKGAGGSHACGATLIWTK